MDTVVNKNFNKKCAFTLAEVLITLVIIGVIAAVTIPTVVNNTKKQEYVSKLKKTYSTLSQATAKIVAENGSAENWVTSTEGVYNLYKKHLSIAKDCGSSSGCLDQASEIKYLYGSQNPSYFSTYDSSNGFRFLLSDGTQVRFTNGVSATCTYNDDGRSNDNCAFIMVDVNGAKKPNQLGRDIFWFVIKSGGLYPRGCEDGSSRCRINNSGDDCACKVIRENAMNY